MCEDGGSERSGNCYHTGKGRGVLRPSPSESGCGLGAASSSRSGIGSRWEVAQGRDSRRGSCPVSRWTAKSSCRRRLPMRAVLDIRVWSVAFKFNFPVMAKRASTSGQKPAGLRDRSSVYTFSLFFFCFFFPQPHQENPGLLASASRG